MRENKAAMRQQKRKFRLYGEEIKIRAQQSSGCYFAIRRGIGLLFENKKMKSYFNEGNTIKKIEKPCIIFKIKRE